MEGYDQRTSKKTAPGTRWCQAIIDIAPAPSPSPERPSIVVLHFFNDGYVQANLGTFKTSRPLLSEEAKLHSAPLPEGKYCRQEVENPFYGIPIKPHME